MNAYDIHLRPDEVKEVVRLDLRIHRLKRMLSKRFAQRNRVLAKARKRKYRSESR